MARDTTTPHKVDPDMVPARIHCAQCGREWLNTDEYPLRRCSDCNRLAGARR